jgi:PAS domain S-box-containing protein
MIIYLCTQPSLVNMINTLHFFEGIFKNAKENSILLMDTNGKILDVNKGFLIAFGYTKKLVVGKNFEFLFTPKDREEGKPSKEIKAVISKGSKSDNNYLLNSENTPIWVLGESLLTTNTDGENYIVKIIQNINTQKRLEGFLLESNEFISTLFDSVKDAAFVILNSELRIIRTNKVFLQLFGLTKSETAEAKLLRLTNPFWKTAEIKRKLTDILVTREPMKNVVFKYTNASGRTKELEITSKLMENEGLGRTILLVIKIK